jgi:hypothetical protein
MKDNEFYVSKSEFQPTKEAAAVNTAKKKKRMNEHNRRRKFLGLLCTGAMIAVVAASAGAETGGEPHSGYIRDAKTGDGISGVSLEFRSGNGVGSVAARTTTDEEGQFSVTLSDGEYTAYATRSGYVSENINFDIDSGQEQELIGTMLPQMSGNYYTIVLTWGEMPSDLDSHVESQIDAEHVMHVFFGDSTYVYEEEQICFLDVDDRSSYGPETITLKTVSSTPYYYYIHNYSGDAEITDSMATVKVYKGTKLLKEFKIPTQGGDGLYWNVFAIKNGEIITKNTVTESPDVTYAE